jgi:enoyl-CoA hydratase/carnithine racemase
MAIMELKWGLVPDMGGYALWRGLVRDDVLRELVYTNREFTGAEAQGFGLATHVDMDPHAKATAIATEIANRNPHAIRAAKRLHAAMIERNTDAILLEESIEQHAIMRSKNQVEAVMAGMEKRLANFEDV